MPNSKGANPSSDPCSRKVSTVNRLREQLRRKREALADHFEYEMYVVFVFKEKVSQHIIDHFLNNECTFKFKELNKKKTAIFKVAEVIPIMTNNYADSIMKGVKENAYTLESSQELLEKDVVQLHAPRYQSMREDVLGVTQSVDFFLWPRNDIDKIVCHLFSRWKGNESSEFRPVQVKFEFYHSDYEKQLLHLLARKDCTGLIMNNPSQSMFLFVNRNRLQTPNNKSIYFNLSSFCLHVPQDNLTFWGPGTVKDVLSTYQD